MTSTSSSGGRSTSTMDVSQDNGSFTWCSCSAGGGRIEGGPNAVRSRELAGVGGSEPREEAGVGVEQLADVADPVAQHRDPFDPDAEREPGVPIGVDPAGAEH